MDWCIRYHKERPTLTLLAYEKALSNRKSWHNQKVSITMTNPISLTETESCDQGTPQGHPFLNHSVRFFKALENYVYSGYDTIQTYDTFSLIEVWRNKISWLNTKYLLKYLKYTLFCTLCKLINNSMITKINFQWNVVSLRYRCMNIDHLYNESNKQPPHTHKYPDTIPYPCNMISKTGSHLRMLAEFCIHTLGSTAIPPPFAKCGCIKTFAIIKHCLVIGFVLFKHL